MSAGSPDRPLSKRPVLVSVCATFLPKEMLHVWRQIEAVEAFDHWVVTRRRENAEAFPFPQLLTLKKSPWRGVHRAWCRARRRRVPLLGGETRQLLEFTSRKHAAVIHVYLGTVAARALDYLARERAARVVSFHGADLSDALSPAEFEGLSARSELFLARSESLAQALRERGCPAERIRLNPTGIPLPEGFSPHRLPPRGSPVRLLQACRLIEKKGLDVTLAAVAQLVRQGRDVLLDLAGNGAEEGHLRAMAAELGIAGRVRFSWISRQSLASGYAREVRPVRPSQPDDALGRPRGHPQFAPGGDGLRRARRGHAS